MKSIRTTSFLLLFLIAFTTVTFAQPGNEHWDSRFGFPGVDGEVKAMAVSGSDVFIGGDFAKAGNIPVSNIIRWNTITHHWYPLGDFPYGVNGTVLALAVDGDKVYVGGQFSAASGIKSRNLVIYNSSTKTWSSLGNIGGSRDYVSAIAIHNGQVIVGGRFTAADSILAANVALYDGAKWTRLKGGAVGPVYAITSIGLDLYIGGKFATVDSITVNNIARWNGVSWSSVGRGTNGQVRALAAKGTDLYVGGSFTLADSIPVSNVARWNTATVRWSALGKGIYHPDFTQTPSVNCLLAVNDYVYAGGYFYGAGNDDGNTRHIARWDGIEWAAMHDSGISTGRGVGIIIGTSSAPGDAYVNALVSLNGDVYVGGRFDYGYMMVYHPGPQGDLVEDRYHARNVIRWDTPFSIWRSLGDSPNADILKTDNSHLDRSDMGDLLTLAMNNNDLIIGGRLTSAGGVAAMNIIQWNRIDHTWSALGSGVGHTRSNVRVITCDGGNIYAAVQLSNVNANNHIETFIRMDIMRWDGLTWKNLGTPFRVGVSSEDFRVRALAVHNGAVYVGGEHINQSFPKTGIYRLDDSTWTPVGGGVNGSISALASYKGALYVGGTFTKAGNVAARNIARWDGATWSALGTGTDKNVDALAVQNNSLFVGGQFTTAGDLSANYIAEWDISSSNWHTLSNGADKRIRTLAVGQGLLYAGGDFTSAGGVIANHIAQWNGEVWGPLADGVNNTVMSIVTTDDEVFAAGMFDIAGVSSSFHIARWSNTLVSAAVTPAVTGIAAQLTIAPTPFRSTTSIRFALPTTSQVRLSIINAMGHEYDLLIGGVMNAGHHTIEWNSREAPSGLYFCRLEYAGKMMVTKLMKSE